MTSGVNPGEHLMPRQAYTVGTDKTARRSVHFAAVMQVPSITVVAATSRTVDTLSV